MYLHIYQYDSSLYEPSWYEGGNTGDSYIQIIVYVTQEGIGLFRNFSASPRQSKSISMHLLCSSITSSVQLKLPPSNARLIVQILKSVYLLLN